MADLATERDITTIPKVELHIHLNGTITEATASELARRHGADPEHALRLIELQRRAARHAFAPPEAKARILGEIEAWVAGATLAPSSVRRWWGGLRGLNP